LHTLLAMAAVVVLAFALVTKANAPASGGYPTAR
jgi:hypothetical protein